MTAETIAQRIVLGIFALLVLAPPLQTVFHPFDPMPLEERRLPAEVREPGARLLRFDPSLGEDLGKWYEDRLGFRDLLIRIKNEIDFSVFGTSRKIYLGHSGWLFHRGFEDTRVGLERMDAVAFARIQSSISALAEYLRRRGIRLMVVGNPLKSTLYPEMLPPDAPRIPQPGRFEALGEFLRSRAEFHYIDGRSILLAGKRQRDVFYRTDLHINYWGTAPLVSEIVRRLEDEEGMAPSGWSPGAAYKSASFAGGDQARFLSKLRPVAETIDQPLEMHELFRDTPRGSWRKDDRPKIHYARWGEQPILDWSYVSSTQGGERRLPPTVLFGNSFSDLYIATGLHTRFAELHRTGSAPERLEPLLRNLPPQTRWFIWQFYEPFLTEVLEWRIPG